jgi:hypothetical protein
MLFTFTTTVELNKQDQDRFLITLDRSYKQVQIVCTFHIVEEKTPAGVYRWYDDYTVVGAVATDGKSIHNVSLATAKEMADNFEYEITEELEWVHEIKHVEGNSTA